MENDNTIKYKSWSILFVITLCVLLAIIAGATAYFDPSMQFHKPINGIRYMMSDTMANYTNPGMIKSYDFDTIILGSSLTHNLRVSWFNEELGLNAIRVSENGERSITINRLLSLAFEKKPNLKNVYCILDNFSIHPSEDAGWNNEYLYKDGLINKIKYLLNKEVVVYQLAPLFLNMATNRTPYSRDIWYGIEEYESSVVPTWAKNFNISARDVTNSVAELDENALTSIRLNIYQNFVPHIEAHPQTEFNFFIPPYQMLIWYKNYQDNSINKQLSQYYTAVEILLDYDNVKVYTFVDAPALICDLNNYPDGHHYTPKIAHQMVKGFAGSEHLIKRENYKEVFDGMKSFFENYNYEAFYSGFMNNNLSD